MERTETFNGVTYVIGKMPVFEQMHVARRLAPMYSGLIAAFADSPEIVQSDEPDDIKENKILVFASSHLAEAFAKMSNTDVDYVVHACLAVCQRKQERGFARIFIPGSGLIFNDIDLDAMIGLVWAVIEENLGSFFPTSQPTSGESK